MSLVSEERLASTSELATGFSVPPEFLRYVRRLRTLHYNGPVPETQNRGTLRANGRSVSLALFWPVRCRALWWDRGGVRQAQTRGLEMAQMRPRL